MQIIDRKTDKFGESDVYRDEDWSFVKRYYYDHFANGWKQKLKPYQYLVLYHQLHWALSLKPIYLTVPNELEFLFWEHKKPILDHPYNLHYHQIQHNVKQVVVSILQLDPNDISPSLKEDWTKVLITHPSYIEGDNLSWISNESSADPWMAYGKSEEKPVFINKLGDFFSRKLNSEYAKYGLTFDPKDFSLMNFKNKWQQKNTLNLICTDLGSSIGRLIERNRNNIPGLGKKLKITIPQLNKDLMAVLEAF